MLQKAHFESPGGRLECGAMLIVNVVVHAMESEQRGVHVAVSLTVQVSSFGMRGNVWFGVASEVIHPISDQSTGWIVSMVIAVLVPHVRKVTHALPGSTV